MHGPESIQYRKQSIIHLIPDLHAITLISNIFESVKIVMKICCIEKSSGEVPRGLIKRLPAIE